MEKPSLKQLAYQQQISHLAHAHSQALKSIIENKCPFKLSVEDVLKYFHLAKMKLEPVQFNILMQLMKDSKEPNYDLASSLTQIYQLLCDHPELLQGFGMFLPPSLNLQFQTYGKLLVNARNKQNTKSVSIKLESKSNTQPQTINSMADSSTSQNVEPMELDIEDNDQSVGKDNVCKEIDSGYAVLFLSKVKERFQNEPHIFEKFLDLLDSVRKNCLGAQTDIESEVFLEVSELFQGHEDLIEEFKTFIPNCLSEEQEEENATDIPVTSLENENLQSAPPTIDLSLYSGVKDPSAADVSKYGSYEEHVFFEEVKKALGYEEVYNNFLRCLILFNEDVITRYELLQAATSFLGRTPSLLKKLKDLLGFKESGENIDVVPMRVIAHENKCYESRGTLDIDYTTGGRNGASYRALPKDHKQPKCSGRTPLCKEVLNDTWVSFPSWSEDSTFVTSCKTQFEEMMYRCEDERFELDMAIRTNFYTLQILENVQKKINKMPPEERNNYHLDDCLGGSSTILHQRALHRLYGDKIEELVEGLKRNPVIAVPIILKRLKGKDEEWKEKQKQFNTVWREQTDNFYLKSLDHQGINFKQNDSKSFRSKNLLNEMDMVYSERKEGKAFNATLPHFTLEFKETSVFADAVNLICQYLKKVPGVSRDDRYKIEHVIRYFIPDFFGFPRMAGEETEDEEEEPQCEPTAVEVDAKSEERSGPASPVGSCANGEDVESDQDELNSVEENEMSEDGDKTDFIEECDVFDKLDPLPSTNLPYVLFFVDKTWYVFYRQFHILCERLSRLLHESKRKDVPPVKVSEEDGSDEEAEKDAKVKISYHELIAKLTQLLNGTMEYTQFEDETRSLFGIYAYVCFTMDKLVLSIVRQLQQIVNDAMSKQCTSYFFQHTKTVANYSFSTPLEASRFEFDYFKKIDRVMEDEKCFKVLWHKANHLLTIELIEEAEEPMEDPCEVEKWSNYLDAYVTEDSVCEDLLACAQGLPVFLKRNLKRQQAYWKNKVVQVENLWKKRYSKSFLKNNPPLFYFRRRRAASALSTIPSKMHRAVEKEETTLPEKVKDNKEQENVVDKESTSMESLESAKVVSDKTNEEKSRKADETVSDKAEKEMLHETEEKTHEEEGGSHRTNEEKSLKAEESKSSDINAENERTQSKSPILIQIDSDDENDEQDKLDVMDISFDEDIIKAKCEEMSELPPLDDGKSDDGCLQPIVFEDVKVDSESMDIDWGSRSPLSNSEVKENMKAVKVTDENNSELKLSFDAEVSAEIRQINVGKEDSTAKESASGPPNIETIVVDDSDDDKPESSVVDTTPKNEKKDKNRENRRNKDPLPRRDRFKTAKKLSDGSRPKRPRVHQDYVKRRIRKSNLRSHSGSPKEKKRKSVQKSDDFEDVGFDYSSFSEMTEDEKCMYLAMKSLVVYDETEASFKKDSYKIHFVQNCDTFIYRRNCLTRAREAHQQISEIKTSNFAAWHRVWLDRYVTPAMVKFCNDWLLRGEPENFKILRVSVTDYTKPPYIPYYKYRVRNYKVSA